MLSSMRTLFLFLLGLTTIILIGYVIIIIIFFLINIKFKLLGSHCSLIHLMCLWIRSLPLSPIQITTTMRLLHRHLDSSTSSAQASHSLGNSDTTTHNPSSLPTKSVVSSPPTSELQVQPLPPPLSNTHLMQIKSKSSIIKPKSYTIKVVPHDSKPLFVAQALCHPQWTKAMEDELHTLAKNQTWSLVLPSNNHKVVGNKWVFKVKRHSDGSIQRYKA